MKTIREIGISSVILIVPVIIGLASFWTFSQIEKAAAARLNTYTVLHNANELMVVLMDAETSEHNYLLTGNKNVLKPYLLLSKSLEGRLENLRQRTSAITARKHLEVLAPLVVSEMVYLTDNIELRRNHNQAGAFANASRTQNKHFMDLIRAEMNSFVRIEEALLVRREAKFQTNMGHLLIVIFAASLLMLLLAFSFVYFNYRDTQQRIKAIAYSETKHTLALQEDVNSQLQQANATLQVSEEKLAVTLNSIGDAVMVTDAQGRVTLLNPLAEQLTGWTLAEAGGHLVADIFIIIDQKTRQIATNPVMETLKNGKAYSMPDDIILLTRGSSERFIADSCAPICDRSGQVMGTVMVFRDITKRKEIEEGLEKSRKELAVIKKTADEASEFAESIINTVREPLISLDQDLRVVSVSRSFYEVFKVNREETVGQLIYDLGNKQWDIPRLRELLETILPQKSSFDNYEVEHDFTTIGRRTMLLNARQIQRATEKERIILLAIEDISERKAIETGLEKTRKELAVIQKTADEVSEYAESIINTVREPLISLDQDLRVVSVSRSFYEVFKVNREETVGQLIYDLGNKQWDIPRLRELLETILPQKSSFDNYEVEHDFTTIGRRTMLLNARQIQRATEKERIILLAIEDISERREIEKGLEKAHEDLEGLAVELKRTTRAKSEFLANMSHELRTPLNSINGFSEILFDETFGPLNERQKEYIEYVLTSGRHLLLLINQILDMSKVESGKMKLALADLSIKNLLNEISLLVADMVAKKSLHMKLEIPEDLPNIEADDLKVKEIIFNLLSNAIKFSANGGKIGMRAKQIGAGIEMEIWDTGIGIAPENMLKIFEGFFRVDTPYSRITEGTGLGLPLAKKMVELHGGTLFVESAGLNKGTMVQFTLPIKSGRLS